jgi:hypothetical protein
MKKFKKRQILAVVVIKIVSIYREELIITFTRESSRIKFHQALTAVSGIATQTFQTIQKVPRNWKLPKLFVNKKKPKIFTFTISADEVKKVAETGYSIINYLYQMKRKNQSKYTYYFKKLPKNNQYWDSGRNFPDNFFR